MRASEARTILYWMIVSVFFASPSLAQESPSTPPSPPISAKAALSDNSDIQKRIQSIFSEIKSFHDVRVRVSAGVVTLDGVVPAGGDINRAEAIAARIQGVVTVQNGLTRDTRVDSNLAPVLGKYSEDLQGIIRAIPLIGVALGLGIVIGLIGYFLGSMNRLWRSLTPNPFLAELVATFVRFTFAVLGLIATLEILGATALLGGVLGGAGVIGIALGLAMRDTVDNFFSSVMLSLRQPFRANDHVEIDGNEGRVIRLTSRATILMTLDGNHLRIPNATVFKSIILNYTRNSERRFHFDLGIDASDNPVNGMAVGLGAVNALEFVLGFPKAAAIIQEIGDSNIVLRFFGWVDQRNTDFGKGRSLAIYAAKSALEAAGFALPEPIYRLRFDDTAPQSLKGANSVLPTPAKKFSLETYGQSQVADVAPDSHIADMVEKERDHETGSDLLDSARPVE
ncbi:MAG: mechanosensitive ion channel family protein [Betaproteobacteria bacterium]